MRIRAVSPRRWIMSTRAPEESLRPWICAPTLWRNARSGQPVGTSRASGTGVSDQKGDMGVDGSGSCPARSQKGTAGSWMCTGIGAFSNHGGAASVWKAAWYSGLHLRNPYAYPGWPAATTRRPNALWRGRDREGDGAARWDVSERRSARGLRPACGRRCGRVVVATWKLRAVQDLVLSNQRIRAAFWAVARSRGS